MPFVSNSVLDDSIRISLVGSRGAHDLSDIFGVLWPGLLPCAVAGVDAVIVLNNFDVGVSVMHLLIRWVSELPHIRR